MNDLRTPAEIREEELAGAKYRYRIHCRHSWPMKPTVHARWVDVRAAMAVADYEINDDGHLCVPDKSNPVVTIPADNVLAIEPIKERSNT